MWKKTWLMDNVSEHIQISICVKSREKIYNLSIISIHHNFHSYILINSRYKSVRQKRHPFHYRESSTTCRDSNRTNIETSPLFPFVELVIFREEFPYRETPPPFTRPPISRRRHNIFPEVFPRLVSVFRRGLRDDDRAFWCAVFSVRETRILTFVYCVIRISILFKCVGWGVSWWGLM